jgi:hypothetical protein
MNTGMDIEQSVMSTMCSDANDSLTMELGDPAVPAPLVIDRYECSLSSYTPNIGLKRLDSRWVELGGG